MHNGPGQGRIEAGGDQSKGDAALLAALVDYRIGEGGGASTQILESLDARMTSASQWIDRWYPMVGIEDVRQQLVCEVLAAAKVVALQPEIWVPKMLMERATRKVRRWARRQARQEADPLPDFLASSTDPSGVAADLPVDIARAVGLSEANTSVLYRHYVLGEPYSSICGMTGLTEAALRSRASRSAAIVRGHLGGRGHRSPV
jgi:DNA-directed RNA polymerase specialized sigma24 family protein